MTVKSDWLWVLAFVVFIAATYIGEAFSQQRKRMKDIEERLARLERKNSLTTQTRSLAP